MASKSNKKKKNKQKNNPNYKKKQNRSTPSPPKSPNPAPSNSPQTSQTASSSTQTGSVQQPSTTMPNSSQAGWQPYSLDRYAHDLVLARRDKESEVLNQVHKMRSTVAFGLERFWGEQHRLDGDKAEYWRDMWRTLAEILQDAGIALPNDANNLWDFNREHRKIAIAILTQLCDCAIWWTQRYKP
jgi:hypothetical protein